MVVAIDMAIEAAIEAAIEVMIGLAIGVLTKVPIEPAILTALHCRCAFAPT